MPKYERGAKSCWNCGNCKRAQLYCKLTVRQISHPAQLPVKCKWWNKRDPQLVEAGEPRIEELEKKNQED